MPPAEIDIELGESPDGYPVDKTAVKVLRLGDGLSKAVDVEPHMAKAGDIVYFAIRAIKVSDEFDYKFDDEGELDEVTLVQVFNAQSATFVDESAVISAIARTEAAVRAAEALKKSGAKPLCVEDHKQMFVDDPEMAECPICGIELPVEDPADADDVVAALHGTDGR